MKTSNQSSKFIVHSLAAAFLFFTALTSIGAPLGTAFTYQGRVATNGTPITNTCDFQFSLWDGPTGGTLLGATQVVAGVTVDDGLFTVELNAAGEFGADAFNGGARWLEVAVRCPPEAGFTTLTPRQPVHATPYALQTRGTFLDDSGNLGVGTDNPTSPLHVAHSVPILTLQDLDGSGPTQSGYVSLRDNAGSEGAWFGYGSSANTDLTFANNAGNAVIYSSGHRLTLTPAGHFGVGTSNPNFQLSLGSTLSNTKIALYETSPDNHYGMGVVAGAFTFHLGGSGARYAFFDSDEFANEVFTIKGSGEVGIGTADPEAELHVMGGLHLEGSGRDITWQTGQQLNLGEWDGNTLKTHVMVQADGDIRLLADRNPVANVYVDGTLAVRLLDSGDYRNVQWDPITDLFFQDNSSRRYKENIEVLNDDFEKLLEAVPMTYTRPGRPDRQEIGFVAEDFDELGLFRLVEYDEQGRPDGIRYDKIALYLVKIVQAQRREIDSLKKAQANNEAEIKASKRRLEQMETLVAENLMTSHIHPQTPP